MKLFTTILMLFLVGMASSQDLRYSNFVNDFADIIANEEEQSLNKKLSDFEKQTTIEFTVVTVESLEGEEVSEFANNLFRKWKVGKKDKNNGLMVLIAPNERKWRIEVGYGLEEYLTDGYTKVVAEDNFPKNFKQSEYYAGILPVVDDFIGRMGKMSWPERQAEIEKKKKESAEFKASVWYVVKVIFFSILFLIGFVLARIFYSNRKERRETLRDKLKRMDQSNRDYIDGFSFLIEQAEIIKDTFPNLPIEQWKDVLKEMENMMPKKLESVDQLYRISQQLEWKAKPYANTIQTKLSIFKSYAKIAEYIWKGGEYNKTLSIREIERLKDRNSKTNYPVTIDENLIVGLLSEFDATLKNMTNNLTIEHLDKLSVWHGLAENTLKRLNDYVIGNLNEIKSYETAETELKSARSTLSSKISHFKKYYTNSDVEDRTIKKMKETETKALNFSSDLSSTFAMMISYSNYTAILNEMNALERRAIGDVSNAEDERRRSARIASNSRRASSGRSSSSGSGIGWGSSFGGFGSSSSDFGSGGSDFGSFGGGDSGGGGSDGGW